MPAFPGLRHSMEVQNDNTTDAHLHDAVASDLEDWATQYQSYLDEKDVAEKYCDHEYLTMNADSSAAEGESWAVEYATFCEEKERSLFGQD